MEKQDFLELYKNLKVNGESVAEMVRERSREAFAEIRNQSVLDGFKAGYEAAAEDLREKLSGMDLTAGFPEINLEDLKEIMKTGINSIDLSGIRENLAENTKFDLSALAKSANFDLRSLAKNTKFDLGSLAESAKFDLSALQESALAGMQGIEDFVDSAEAGVRAKMAELKEIEISKRDKKIAIMVAAAVVTLIVSTVILSKRYEKKKLIRQRAGKAGDVYEEKEDKEESKEDKESGSGSCVREEVSEACEEGAEGADCVESGKEAGEADAEGTEVPGEE